MNKRAKAIKTNGKGQRTTAHLNLTRSLADVWADAPKAPPQYPDYFDNKFTAKTRRQL